MTYLFLAAELMVQAGALVFAIAAIYLLAAVLAG